MCVCVCVCVCARTLRRDHFNCFLIPAESTLNTCCLINNASLYKGLLLFVYTHNDVAFCHLSFLSVNKLSLSQKLTETYRLCYVSHCFFPLFICKLNQIYFNNLFLLCVYIHMYCRFYIYNNVIIFSIFTSRWKKIVICTTVCSK